MCTPKKFDIMPGQLHEFDSSHVHLKWQEHEIHMLQCMERSLLEETFADVTLVCGKSQSITNPRTQLNVMGSEEHSIARIGIRAHKILLCISSGFFERIFKDNPCHHPVVILPEEINLVDLRSVLEFVYKGEVTVARESVNRVLSVAELLDVRGISFAFRDSLLNLNRESSFGLSMNEKNVTVSQPIISSSSSSRRKSSPKFRFTKRKGQNGNDNSSCGKFGEMNVKTEESAATSSTFSETCQRQSNFSAQVTSPQHKSKLASSVPFGLQKTYAKKDMRKALEALKEKRMTLTRASEHYCIPATTLWQKAHRLGIATPKKEMPNKTWSESDLERALTSLRNKEISANKAAKRYGIPSSTLYKIARKEQIELAQPFNAVQTSWTQTDLEKALVAIRKGMPVQKASKEFGIPSGTLYGRCKKAQIELIKINLLKSWSEIDMHKALESVRLGKMSINQAAIHHNLPYSSLYGRIARLKRENPDEWNNFQADIGFESSVNHYHQNEHGSSSLAHPFHQLNFLHPEGPSTINSSVLGPYEPEKD